MKPSSFVYHRPTTIEDALDLLAEIGSEGKVLAGGQSLVPLMSMRLAAPAHLVDVNRIDGLAGIQTDVDGVRVGATARHADVEHHEATYAAVPLLRQAVKHVAHPTIRNRGTTVGSLAHADPSGEMTAVLALLGGTVTLRRRGGERRLAAGEFFVGPLESAVGPGELAVEAFFPRPAPRSGTAWAEVSRRHGDYAVCGVGAVVTLAEDRRVEAAKVGLISVGPTPVVVDVTDAIVGQSADAVEAERAGRLVMDTVDPDADIHATAEYRRHLAGTLAARALTEAAARASERAA